MAAILVGLAALSVKHMAPLPKPDDEARLTRSMLQLRRSSMPNFLVHVIYAECSCSRALFAHFIQRHPFPDTEEAILFVGVDRKKEESARSVGFNFTSVSAEELAFRFGLEVAPVLIVFDSAGRLLYAGGYYDHPAAIAPLDRRIYAQLTAGTRVEPLPIFGCAVSYHLKGSLNPLGCGVCETVAVKPWFFEHSTWARGPTAECGSLSSFAADECGRTPGQLHYDHEKRRHKEWASRLRAQGE
jgi:hypothetical protein